MTSITDGKLKHMWRRVFTLGNQSGVGGSVLENFPIHLVSIQLSSSLAVGTTLTASYPPPLLL